jgi:hypothetical protein
MIILIRKQKKLNAFLEQLKFNQYLEIYNVEFFVSLVKRTQEEERVNKFIA